MGSSSLIPDIQGLDEVGCHTSDTILSMEELPESIAIVGGGYIAAEYGHFLSAMGADVAIVGRNSQFLPQEEPEVAAVARRELEKHMRIITNHEVRRVFGTDASKKGLVAVDLATGREVTFEAEEILIAAGRAPNADVLHPEKGGIEVDPKGWIVVNNYLETSQPNVYALGDPIGKHLFKHVANYESIVVFYNAVLGQRVKVDYHAVPHAVFTYPEIEAVGLREDEAVREVGSGNALIGFHRYEDTAKGEAMGVKDYFVKVIVERGTYRILGAHIVGPYASILIQEIINLMYTHDASSLPILQGMHIHPALSEVVERAFSSLMIPEEYRDMARQMGIAGP